MKKVILGPRGQEHCSNHEQNKYFMSIGVYNIVESMFGLEVWSIACPALLLFAT